MRKLVFALLFVALSIASAKTYSVTLYQPSVVGGTELRPGDYKLDVKDSAVVIKNGKQSVESAVKVENSDAKFSSTTVRYANSDGKFRIQEIRLGGTTLKLVFN